MFMGNLALILNLLSIFVLAFGLVILLMSLGSRLYLSPLLHITFSVRKAILWSIASAPWWIATICVVLFGPNEHQATLPAWLNNILHWHHIVHFNPLSWHSLTLLLALTGLVWLSISMITFVKNQLSALSAMHDLCGIEAQDTIAGKKYYSLPLRRSTAFTAGLFSPKIYLSSGLLSEVNRQEKEIIIAHEQAHVSAYDPLFKMIFSCFACFYPAFLTRKLNSAFTLLTEQVADYRVAKLYDKLDVAQTLITIARKQQIQSRNLEYSSLCYFSQEHTTARVKALIDPIWFNSGLALLTTALFFIIAPIVTAIMIDLSHHLFETFFIHL